MSNIIETLVVKIASDITDFQTGITNALRGTAEFEQAVSKIGNVGEGIAKVGTDISKVGEGLTTKLTLPIVGLGTAIGKIGMDFEAQMSKVQAISGASGEDLDRLTAKAMEMGSKTKFSATESGQALEYMAMAGWKTDQMLDGLPGIMNLAAASGENLATVSDIVTDALTAFGLKAEESAHFADILAAASSNSNTNVAMLGETFKYVAPVAGALGYSAEDTAIAIGLMANSGIKASQAGTSLRSTFTRLSQACQSNIDIVEKQEKAMQALPDTWKSYSEEMTFAEKVTMLTGSGFNKLQATMGLLGITSADSTGKMRPLSEMMTELRDKTQDLSEQDKAFVAKTLAGQEAMSGFLAIVNATDEDVQKLTESIYGCDGVAQQMADTMNDNLKGKLTILKSSLEGVALQLYNLLVPSFEKAVEKVQSAVTWFSNLSAETQGTIIKIAGIAAAVGPALIVVGNVTRTIGNAVNGFSQLSRLEPLLSKAKLAMGGLSAPVLIVAAAVAALIALFVGLYNTNEEFRTKVQAIWEELCAFFQSAFEGIKNIAENIFNELKEFWDTWGSDILAVLSAIWDGIGVVANAALDGLIALVSVIFNGLKTFWDTWGNDILSVLSLIWETIKTSFETAVSGITDIAKAIFNALKQFWDTWGSDITNAFKRLLDTLKATFSSIFESIKTIISSIFDAIKAFRDTWGGTIKTLFTATFNAIKTLVETIFNDIKRFWDTWGNTIQAAFTALWRLVCNAFETALNVLKNVFVVFEGIFTGNWRRAWEGVKGIFTSILDGIKNAFSIVFDALLFIAKDIFDKIKSAVSEKFNAVKETITNILDSITGMFTALPDKAKEWGKNLIGGFVDGIKSMASEASNAANNIVKNVSDFLGFNSPSKKGEGRFITHWGYNMIDGFLDGVKNAVPLVNQTMNKVIPNLDNAIEQINVSGGNVSATEMGSGIPMGGDINNNTDIIINTEGLFKGAVLNVRDDSDIDKIVRLVVIKLADFIAQKNRISGLQLI